MHRDLDFGSRIGNDHHNQDLRSDKSDFSCGSQSFWQDTYKGISRLNQRDNPCNDQNRISLDLGSDESLYGSFKRHGNERIILEDRAANPCEEAKCPEVSVQSSQIEQENAEHKHENTELVNENTEAGQEAPPESKNPFEQLRENICAMLESMRAALGDEMTDILKRMFDQIINQMEAPTVSQTASPESQSADLHSSDLHNSESQSSESHNSESHNSESHSTDPHDSQSERVAEGSWETAPKGDMAQVLFQNDWGRRGIVQADIPFHGGEGWGDGKYGYPPTADVTNYSPWGVVSQQVGKNADENATINVKDQHVYFHLKGGGWVEAASPANTGYWEAEYRRDFAGNQSWGNGAASAADGSYQFGAPSEGRVDHFGSGNTALKFDPAKYDGIFQSIDAKADRDDSGLVINFGGDYQRDYGITQNEAGQTEANLRNPAAGANNWTPLTSNYQRLYFTTMTDEAFKNDPPPGIA